MNTYSPPMTGDLMVDGRTLMRAGFLAPPNGERAIVQVPSQPMLSRFAMAPGAEFGKNLEKIQRGEFTGDVNQILMQLGQSMQEFQRTITSTMTAFPVRENLEAEAKILVPLDTPVRNRLKRKMGSGKASAWKQVTSLGGGFGFQSTVTTGASSATQTVGSTAGMRAGDILWFATTAAARTVSSITDGVTVVLTATISTTTAETVTNTSFPNGAGANANSQTRAFFAETGAPAARSTVYADKNAAYKLLGSYFDITGFAMAAGANYDNQLEVEKTNAIRNLMLNEENALLNGDSSAITGPWGDGTNALAFDGLNHLITTGNGTPSAQIQTSVGALTTAHIDAQLKRLWEMGARDIWFIMSGQEALSLVHLAEATGSIIRVQATAQGETVLGVKVTGYVNPLTGQMVDVVTDRFQVPGTILYCSDMIPDGTSTMDVEVLPQVQLPQLAPTENIQGYTAQVLAPSQAAPQVYPGIISVYEVLRLKSALHVAKSSGVTAV